jgi:hypothetical protein
MKMLFYVVIAAFIGITNYAFIHHMVFEQHDINYHIVTDKAEAHDHCTLCKIIEHQQELNDYYFISPVKIIALIEFDSSVINSHSFSRSIQLRGPPHLLFA